MSPGGVIDSHQHVFYHGRDDAGLIRDMDEQGIESAWLLTWEIAKFEDYPGYHGVLNPLNARADGTHAGIPLRDLLLARERYPERFVVGYCPHPLLGDAPAMLKNAVDIHGVRVCGEWKFRIPFDDPRCLELFRMAGKLGLPVVLHLDVPYLMDQEWKHVYQPLWYGGTVDNLERALQACPETKFIGHAPGFWREISGDAGTEREAYPRGPIVPGGRLYDLFDQYGNLYADLSAGSGLGALRRDLEHAVQFIERFQDRLLFARDYYGGVLADFLNTLDLPTSIQEKLYRGNAIALLASTS